MGRAAAEAKSYVFATVRTYSSCAAMVYSASLMLCDAIVGYVGANYSGRGLVQLEAWKMADFADWQITSPDAMFKGDFE